MRRFLPVIALLFLAASARAQDVLTLGTGVAAPGGSASVPVSILDRTGTPLGTDAGTGNRIQGIAFKVFFPPSLVSSVTFTRGGVAAGLTPLFETTLQGTGWISYVASFRETTNAIPLNPNPPAPGDTIGTLTVMIQPAAANGATVLLTLDPGSAMLSNQAGSVRETVAATNANLALVNGSVNVTTSPAPASLVATAASGQQVNLTWIGVAGSDHYEVWRYSGSAFTRVGTPSASAFNDGGLAPLTTYLYEVRAIDGGGNPSPFSNLDAATTIIFADDPAVAHATLIRNLHMAELRQAVNAFRATANLSPLAADPTLGVGQTVRAQHVAALRTGLDQARSTLGLPPLTYTDPTLTPGSTVVMAGHVQELRNGVK